MLLAIKSVRGTLRVSSEDMENVMAESAASAETSAAVKQSRDQSTIQFPYGDLNDAIGVAAGMMKLGAVAAEPDQLAGAMSLSPGSGNFRTKIGTAKTFGVIETQQGKYKLTDLGFSIVDKDRAASAKVEAFLKVDLYRKLYEDFRGKQLPPRPAALENTFVNFGVAPKQKERARQAFDRSAQQAGFFDAGGRDRLIKPAVAALGSDDAPTIESPIPETGDGNGGGAGYGNRSGGGNGGGRPPRGLHPFIEGLLQTLPEPGTLWTIEGRAAWLQAAAQNFTLIYKGEGKIDVQAVAHPRSAG